MSLEEPEEPEVLAHPVAELGGGALAIRHGNRAWIVVDPALAPPARRAAVTHEVVHLLRGPMLPVGDLPPGWHAVVAREEGLVDAEVARRLVPADRLARAVERWLAADDAVTVALVADEFATTPEVAARALALLSATSAPRPR